MARLLEQEIAHCRQHGYPIPSFASPQARVEQLRQSLDRLIHDNPGVRPEKLVSAHVAGAPGAGNVEGVRGHADFLDLAMEPDILDMVQQLIGLDIILWGCHVFFQPAGDGMEPPWHQDGHYWPICPLANCTGWVALDASTAENGCLQVIPGSHSDRATHAHLLVERQDQVLSQRTDLEVFDSASAVGLELQPGQRSMPDVYMIHGANVNHSTRRRVGVAQRYMPGSSVFERNLNPVDGKSGVPAAFATRPLWLLRGRDQTVRNDFSMGL